MKNTLLEKNTQVIDLDIKSIFGKKFSVIIEYIKSNVDYTINIKMSNGFFQKQFSESKLINTTDGNFLLCGNTYYKNSEGINHIINNENYDQDIENALYVLTKDIQDHLLKMEAECIVEDLKIKGIDIKYNTEKNGANLDFIFFNVQNPRRSIILFLDDGDYKFEFQDTQKSSGEIESDLSKIEVDDYDIIYKWLNGESLT